MELHDKLFDTETIAELVAIKYFKYKKVAEDTIVHNVFSTPEMRKVFKDVVDLFKESLNIDLKIYIGVLNLILHSKFTSFCIARDQDKPQTYTFYTNTNVIINLTILQCSWGRTYNVECSYADKSRHILRYDPNNHQRSFTMSSNIDLHLKIDKDSIVKKIVYLPRMINDYLMICPDEYIAEILKLSDNATNILVEQLIDKNAQLQQDKLTLVHNLTDVLNKLEMEIQKK